MISVLMSVYHNEQPGFLNTALKSLAEQTVSPSEIVLVRDGELTRDLDHVIDGYRDSLNLTVVSLPTNSGLATALNFGLQHCTQPWIMRFDTDDFCLPNRVALQMAVIETQDYDLIGGQVAEFDTDPLHPHQSRTLPLQQDHIVKFSRRRNPFNHMAVCFRKSFAENAGGYPEVPLMEDYALWLKMIAAGARTMNQPETLVHARVGHGMIERRGGRKYLRSEWQLQRLFFELGMKPRWRCLIDGTLRSAAFIAPTGVKKLIYKKFLRKS